MGVRLGVGGGFQQGSPILSSVVRCYVCFLFLSAFYNPERHSGNEPQSHTLGCPSLLCVHPGLGGGWGGSCPSPLPACSSRTCSLEGLSWSGHSQGVQGAPSGLLGPAGVPAEFIERMLAVPSGLEGSPSAYCVALSPTHCSWPLPSPPHPVTSVPSLPPRLLALSDLALLGHWVARVQRLQSGESDWFRPAPIGRCLSR